ncbi:MAG TPA: amino acid racemase [Dehalococcoidia bacterium]|jgi:aspartate racemase|nr:amino acid racemase [Dehalococcoidia bacterium]
MRKIGILGGMAPESTVEYYRIITTLCRQRGMGHRYPVIIIYSLNFHEFISLVESGNLPEVTNLICDAINSLSEAGADFALVASNTPHIVFNEVAARSPIPLLSIVDETGRVAKNLGFTRVGLFGTKFTMQADFYSNALSTKYGISVVTPQKADQDYIHHKIMTELVDGCIIEETRQELSRIARMMADKRGIQALILGCTELPLILSEEVVGIPLLDTTRIHAEAALNFSQSSSSSV